MGAVQNLRFLRLPQKDGMSWGFQASNQAADHITAGRGDHRKPGSRLYGNILKFIRVPAAVKTERADQRGIRIFSQDGKGEASRPFNAAMGVIIVINAHRKGSGLRRDLHDAVGHAAHGPFSVQGGGDVNTVIQLKKGLNIHVLPPSDIP